MNDKIEELQNTLKEHKELFIKKIEEVEREIQILNNASMENWINSIKNIYNWMKDNKAFSINGEECYIIYYDKVDDILKTEICDYTNIITPFKFKTSALALTCIESLSRETWINYFMGPIYAS